jgi:two-component SAPR family response regulator
VAFKMFKRKFANKTNIAPIYASFCQKVDRELLDKEFYYEIVKQYHRKIQQHKLNSDLFEKMPMQI